MAKQYVNHQIIVHWDASLCIHVAICVNELPQVFDVNKRPWVNVDGAGAEEIIKIIDKCPTGALQYSLPEGSKVDQAVANGPNLKKIND